MLHSFSDLRLFEVQELSEYILLPEATDVSLSELGVRTRTIIRESGQLAVTAALAVLPLTLETRK